MGLSFGAASDERRFGLVMLSLALQSAWRPPHLGTREQRLPAILQPPNALTSRKWRKARPDEVAVGGRSFIVDSGIGAMARLEERTDDGDEPGIEGFGGQCTEPK